MMKRFAVCTVLAILCVAFPCLAQEVGKGQIPESQLAPSTTQLDWGVAVWDVDDAVKQLKSKDKVLWVDTRPESFFVKGTVRGGVFLQYNRQGESGNDMTQETLDKAVAEAGLDKASAKVIMFCQGPKCHRSYNATFMAVKEWGYAPENVVWFRAGYPLLFEAVKADPKLKRKAKKYISDAGIKAL